MKMRLLTGEEMPAILKRLMKTHDKLFWAVAWGSDNPALAELRRLRSKIDKLVIGTHFYQTPPAFLEEFEDVATVRAMPPTGATFHPKVYLFVSRERSALVVGSANFTQAAMAANVEACCLIEGASDEQLFSDARDFITDTCWPTAKAIDADFLRAYRIQYAATKAARTALQKFVPLKRPKTSADSGDPMEMSWAEFVRKVRSDEHYEMRLRVLARARILLSSVDKFSMLTQTQRKAIAGTLGNKEDNPGSLDWGLFGHMFGFGILKRKINDNATEISDAMDCIPPAGPVTEDDYNMFAERYEQAFHGESRVGGIASASRLLAMKRPDYFVCFDKANRNGLSAHFGIAASAVTLETYWANLIEPITLSPWWRSPRPSGPEGKIWDGRAALLDALFYEPT